MRLYLAGPMRGVAHWNFPAFATAAAALRADGHTVLSPAEHDREVGWNPFDGAEPTAEQLAKMFQWDLASVVLGELDWAADQLGAPPRYFPLDAVALLPGWRQSRGALLEVLVAVRCGLKLYQFEMGQVCDSGRHLREIQPPKLAVVLSESGRTIEVPA